MLMAKPFLGPVNRTIITLFLLTYIVQAILLVINSYFLYVVRVFLVVTMCFEFCCRLILPTGAIEYNGNFTVPATLIGFRLRPGSVMEYSTKTIKDDTIYHVYYTADEFGRRIVSTKYLPVMDGQAQTKTARHALFLGCSYTFGSGVDDTSTFPSIFSQKNSDFHVYNYGFSGYGPHQMPLLFKDGINVINDKSVIEDTGICVYTYIQDHLNRVYGGSVYLSYGSNTPDVYIENGNAIYQYRSGFQNSLSKLLNNSYAAKYFNVQLTYPKTIDNYRRFAEIINYTAKQYRNLKPHGKFYVSIFPGEIDTSWLQYLEREIGVVKVPPPADLDKNQKYKIQGDDHPSYYLNRYYAEKLTDFLR